MSKCIIYQVDGGKSCKCMVSGNTWEKIIDMDAPKVENFTGSLVGQCLGDAVGFPVEGYSPSVCRKYAEDGQVGKTGKGEYQFGQYTDDSQLARELVDSFVSLGRFDPADYAKRIAFIFAEKRIVGHGAATKESAEKLAMGVLWTLSGAETPSAGAGSAMRAGPVGLMFFDNPALMIKAACDQGRITHKDLRCQAGSVAIAGAVALALLETSIDVKRFTTILSGWVGEVEPTMAEGINNLPEWVDMPEKKAFAQIASYGKSEPFNHKRYGIAGFVLPSALWSLYSFLKTPDDYWKSIRTCIIAGGDTDTTAAMTGAISGAYLGLEALPLELARKINDNETWGFEQIVELGEKLHKISVEVF